MVFNGIFGTNRQDCFKYGKGDKEIIHTNRCTYNAIFNLIYVEKTSTC